MTLPGWVRLLRAPNPGPMPLEGTNTWVLDGGPRRLVVDPGPLHEGHLREVAGAAQECVVVLTHHHPDHAEGVPRYAELSRAPVRAADPTLCRGGGPPLRDGERWEVAGLEVEVLRTPGHTGDSVCLVVAHAGEQLLLTGDTVLGRGTSVVAHPDGRLGDYLASLRRLEALGDLPVLPGHGPALPSSAAVVASYLDHRLERLAQVRGALAGGAGSVEQVVERVYGATDPGVRDAARRTVRAQLAYLAEAEGLSAPGG